LLFWFDRLPRVPHQAQPDGYAATELMRVRACRSVRFELVWAARVDHAAGH
jgi:hypothetical protein